VIVHRRRSLALYLPASLRKREQEEETHRGLTTHSGPSRENKLLRYLVHMANQGFLLVTHLAASRLKDAAEVSLRERKSSNIDLAWGVKTKAWRWLAGRRLDSTLLAALRDAKWAADMLFLAEVNPSPGQSGV
jgi:hypothetical protein